MTRLVSQRVMADLSLLHSPWLQVEALPQVSETQFLGQIQDTLTQILSFAGQQKLEQISVVLPIEWEVASQHLEQLGWKPSLTSLVSDISRALPAPNSPLPQVSFSPPHISQVIPLLEEQANFHAHHFPHYYRSSATIDWDAYRQEISADLASGQNLSAFYRENEKIIGMILGEIQENTAHLFDFVVLPSHRGQGIGETLLKSYASHAKSLGITKIVTETWLNQPSLRLYTKLGFAPTSQEFFSKPEFAKS